MQLKIINSNHAELIFNHSCEICFSYGRCAVIKNNGIYHVNDDVYGFSKTTSQHINYTFPELKQKIKDNDINVLHYSDDDAIENVFYEFLLKEC